MATPLTTFDAVSDQLFSFMLLNRYRSPWVYSPSLAFLKDNDAWNVLLSDTDVAGIRQKRNQSVVREWRVGPDPHASNTTVSRDVKDKSKRKAAICNEGLSHIDDFDMSRFINADSFFLGRRYAKIEFEEVFCSLDGTPPATWFLPVRVQDVDRRRFRWLPVWSDGAKSKLVRVDLSMFDLNTGEWVVLDMDKRRHFIEDVWEPTEDRIGHGRGAIEALFFTHFFKTGTIQKVMQFVDSVANGRFVVTLDSTRGASTDLPNDVIQSTTLANLKKARTEHFIVLQNGDKLEHIESNGAGADVSMDLVHYFVESAERLANGAVRQSGHSPGGTGAKAASETEADTAESYYQFARDHHDNTYNRDLLGAFLYWNEHNFEKLGLASPEIKRPRFSSQQEKKQDPKEAMEILNTSKAPVPLRHYYATMQCPEPEPDEEVVEASPDPAMADMEVDGETGLPKTSGEARQHEEKMAKAKKADKKPAKFAAPSGEMTRTAGGAAEGNAPVDGGKVAEVMYRFKHLNLPHKEVMCDVCRRIEGMGAISHAQALEYGFPHGAHPNCDHVWVVDTPAARMSAEPDIAALSKIEERMDARFDALERAITRTPQSVTVNNSPQPAPQQNIALHVPSELKIPPVEVHVAPAVVHLPPQPPAAVHVPPAQVHFKADVHVLEHPQLPAPVVNVHMPEQKELAGGIAKLLEFLREFALKFFSRQKKVTITKDENGRIQSAEIEQKP